MLVTIFQYSRWNVIQWLRTAAGLIAGEAAFSGEKFDIEIDPVTNLPKPIKRDGNGDDHAIA